MGEPTLVALSTFAMIADAREPSDEILPQNHPAQVARKC